MFSAFNPSKCTHLAQWAADCAAPGEQSWTSCRSSNPQPWVSSPTLYPLDQRLPSQYLSLSLTHTHTRTHARTHAHTHTHTHTRGESEKITAHTDDRVNGPLLKVFPPPELSFRIHGTGSDRFPFKSMCQLKSVQSQIRS